MRANFDLQKKTKDRLKKLKAETGLGYSIIVDKAINYYLDSRVTVDKILEKQETK